jgi:hypothetical protein
VSTFIISYIRSYFPVLRVRGSIPSDLNPNICRPPFSAQKTTLTIPLIGVSQRLAWSREETAPLPSTQPLPHIDKGQEIDAFVEIEEGDQQHAANLTSTSAGATVSSGRSDGGGLPHSTQQVPSSEQTTQG